MDRIASEIARCTLPDATPEDDVFRLLQYAAGELLSNAKYHSGGQAFVCVAGRVAYGCPVLQVPARPGGGGGARDWPKKGHSERSAHQGKTPVSVRRWYKQRYKLGDFLT